MLSRSTLLASALAAALHGGAALAFGDASRLTFAFVRHGGSFDPRPGAMRRLGYEIAKRTSIEVAPEARTLALTDPDLFRYPLLILTGDGGFPPFSDAEVAGLRRYLSYGGFLLADAADGGAPTGFDASFRREMARVLPGQPLQRIPREHVLYKTFYLLDRPAGRLMSQPFLEGIQLGHRMAVVYTQNDLAGAYARDSFGSWELEVVPGGEPQREMAVRMGINLVMYALCLDYKEDQVHIPFIMKRRR